MKAKFFFRYMAPELAAKKPYTHVVDFYSLGVVAYELLVGKTPFKCKSTDNGEFAQLIQKKEPSIPAKFSPELKDFLSQLLQKDPSKRLGAEGGADQIMSHPWLADVDFTKLANKEIQPPITVSMDHLNLVLSELELEKECELDEENPNMGRNVRLLSRFSFSEDTVNETPKEDEVVVEETKELEVPVEQTIQIEFSQIQQIAFEEFLAEIPMSNSRKESKDYSTIVNQQFFETLRRRSRFSSCDIMPFTTETQEPLMMSATPVV